MARYLQCPFCLKVIPEGALYCCTELLSKMRGMATKERWEFYEQHKVDENTKYLKATRSPE